MPVIDWDDVPEGRQARLHFPYVATFKTCRKEEKPFAQVVDTSGKALNMKRRVVELVEKEDLPDTARAKYAKTSDDPPEWTVILYHEDQEPTPGSKKKKVKTHARAGRRRRKKD